MTELGTTYTLRLSNQELQDLKDALAEITEHEGYDADLVERWNELYNKLAKIA